MEKETAYMVIAGICLVVLAIVILKYKAQFLLNFFVRMILGAFGIYYINGLLAEQGISIAVGLNPISLLTTGVLGFSGLILLYIVIATKFL